MISRILLYNSGGGIGDALQILPLINALRNEFKNADFYYLCAHENHFLGKLKDYNINVNNLDLGIRYFGFRWWHLLILKRRIKERNIEKFDLIIDLQSKFRNSLILKMIPHKYFISSCLNFKFSKPNLNIKKINKINNNMLQAVNILLNINCKLVDYDLNNIEDKYTTESKKLLPKNNYFGFSITQGNVYRKKQWPLKNIINLCNIFKQSNKTPVFFY